MHVSVSFSTASKSQLVNTDTPVAPPKPPEKSGKFWGRSLSVSGTLTGCRSLSTEALTLRGSHILVKKDQEVRVHRPCSKVRKTIARSP